MSLAKTHRESATLLVEQAEDSLILDREKAKAFALTAIAHALIEGNIWLKEIAYQLNPEPFVDPGGTLDAS